MANEKVLRRQAAACAVMAEQTHDEESRQRCLRLEQTYLELAETEELLAGGMSTPPGESEAKLTA